MIDPEIRKIAKNCEIPFTIYDSSLRELTTFD